MYNWIGKSVARKEDYPLLTGKGKFVADLKADHMLHACFLRSPYAHAHIRSIDTGKAVQMAGVYGVWTSEDLKELGEIEPLAMLPLSLREKVSLKRREWTQPALAKGKVRFVGEPVAVLLAESRHIAEDAAELIEVNYEVLESVTSSEQALRSDTRLFEDWPDNVQAQFEVETGNYREFFEIASVVVERTYEMKRSTGVPMECRGVFSELDPHTGQLLVTSSTQVPHFVRDNLVAAFGCPVEQIRVVAPDVGGGFGIKGNVYPEELVIPFLTWKLKVPIKWVEDRMEHMKTGSHARDQIHRIRAAFSKDGMLLAVDDEYHVDSGAYNLWETCVSYNSAAHLLGPYRCLSYHNKGYAVLTNKSPSAPYRGAGRPEAVFAMERLLDEAAELLSMDRMEIRRRNLIHASEMPYIAGIYYRDGKPVVYDSGDFASSFERLLEAVDYKQFKEDQLALRRNNRYIGLGLACFVEGTGIGPFEGAVVGIEPDGVIRVATGAATQGQSHYTVFAQICAEAMELDLDRIQIREGDTQLIAKGIGTFASRSAVVAGSAIFEASKQFKEKLLAYTAKCFDMSREDLVYDEGTIRHTVDDAVRWSLPDLARYAFENGDAADLEVEHYFYPETVTYANGVHAAIVEVDIHTGQVNVQKYYVVHDCGVEINPQVVKGQLFGGLLQGLGGALFEELAYEHDGRLGSGTLKEYLLPNVYHMPEVEIIHAENRSIRNELGIKGTGEGGAICPPAAVANAVANALEPFGVQIREVPVMPERIKRLINESKTPEYRYI
ncbi:xanthine dehydrogenase family protein molybdopterin-binding subunit [Paenibacillus beijingensis]|uniref:Aldehyde oxidase/xanthine dehydrogenase a/b hammerhead domain-containing protein n=1 Tax=Paenibacillus beijingensis TaxID=1126833 RepID=A0A0D5NE19_9BACL|nr:xanthine dehydrogenase family protein molybdopterin-binding subunit [Paenibacillus beijingensis]AJY73501.1 hypothetical protein VN24_01270 [Paenibacillus beijingensis]